jgi:hypothetical protein
LKPEKSISLVDKSDETDQQLAPDVDPLELEEDKSAGAGDMNQLDYSAAILAEADKINVSEKKE